MKRILFLFAILSTALLHSQNNNSLLWEISGNGLAKKSYVYGSMHVSDKISYHLSDAFFRHLLEADIVSNESDPETWSDISVFTDKNNDPAYKFYTEFYLSPAKKENIHTAFENRNSYFTNMLSGGNEDQADYQESTVLDMFIYQTGRKYKKKIVGLENAKQSMLTVLKIGDEEVRPTDKNIHLLVKILKGKSFNEALNTYYREKDVVMIDSLYRMSVSKRAHELLITGRNYIMTKSIDSLARQGSLFAAVGAAHLGGKKGIIQLLRDKGYKVEPVIDVLTEKGEKQKKEIEEYFPNSELTVSGTADEMIQMPMFKKPIKENNNIGSPDFTNGGVLFIKRIPLNYFLKQQTVYNPKSLDSLFFENIAGNIIEKKYFEQENYSGYDIKSITKTGNTQRFRYYITPLELIAISMTGTGNYVRKYESNIFDKIKIKSFKNSWEKITLAKGGFSVEVPNFNIVYGNTKGKNENIEIQAYNNIDKSYYFVTERTQNEIEQLENTAYEHRQIHYEFYLQQDMDSTATHYDKANNSLESSSSSEKKKIRLKTLIKDSKYYLLGTVDASEQNTRRFFESFTSVPFNYTSETKKLMDTTAHFEIEIPEEPNEILFLKPELEKKGSKNTFTQKSSQYTFQSESGKQVHLAYYKYAKYESMENMDSIYSGFKRMVLKQYEADTDLVYGDTIEPDDSVRLPDTADNDITQRSLWDKIMSQKNENYKIVSESTSYDKEKNIHTINTIVTKKDAAQAIRYKIMFKDDSYHMLSALIEKDYAGNDPFIEKTFNTFQITGKDDSSVFKDKVGTFINDALSEKDTIRYSALKSVYQLKLNKTDFDAITNFLNTFDFKANETETIQILLAKTAEIKDTRTILFLEDYYKKENTKTEIQISVLRALASQNSKAAYQKILELLEYDLPITDNEDDITSLFEDFENDPENSKELFPKIFEYYSIKEYNYPVIHFCNSLADKKLINLKQINGFKKIIITNARLEYKRAISRKQKSNSIVTIDNTETTEYDEDEYNNSSSEDKDLINYTKLIYNFKKDRTITELLEKINTVDAPELNMELTRLGIINNRISDTEILKSLDNPEYRYQTLQLLLRQNRKSLISKLSDDDIAKSAIISLAAIKIKDTLRQLEKKIVLNNGNEITYYFFELLKKKQYSDITVRQLYTIAFINTNKRINPLAYKILTQKRIEENENNNALYEAIINESLNDEHSRASFEKIRNVENNYLYDHY